MNARERRDGLVGLSGPRNFFRRRVRVTEDRSEARRGRRRRRERRKRLQSDRELVLTRLAIDELLDVRARAIARGSRRKIGKLTLRPILQTGEDHPHFGGDRAALETHVRHDHLTLLRIEWSDPVVTHETVPLRIAARWSVRSRATDRLRVLRDRGFELFGWPHERRR